MNQEIEQSTTSEPPDKEARTWGMVCHLMGLAMVTVIPFSNVLGPLIVWAIKKDEHEFINAQGKEAINFQLTMTIGFILLVPLCFIFIGIPLMFALFIFDLIMIIIAAVKSNEGTHFRYPVTIRFFK